MIKINQISKIFEYNQTSTHGQKSEYISWDFSTRENDFSCYIDLDIHKGFRDKKDGRRKILWTLESPKFNSGVFEIIENNLDEVLETYEYILTYNKNLIGVDDKFKWVPATGFWIQEPKIHPKNKLISMISSNKLFSPQQRFRVDFAKKNIKNIDIFGRGFLEIKNKEQGLNDYQFSVCIENDTFDDYFTEKLLDCFATGTIPIYMGTKNISNYFNSEGIIFLDEININEINSEIYYSKMNAVMENFEIVKQYKTPEDFIFTNYLNKHI